MVFRVLRRYWRSLTTLVLMASAVVWVVDGLDGRKAQVKPWEALVHELTRDAMAAESLQAPADSLAEKSAHQTGVKSDAKPGTPQLIPDHEVGSDDGRIPGTFARRTIEVAQNAIHPGASKRLAATEDEQAEKLAKEATPANARRQQVRQEVEAAFAARQQGYEAEVRELRRRLQTIEERLETRSRLKKKIIDRRVEELVNPAVKWDETVNPGNLNSSPPASYAAKNARWSDNAPAQTPSSTANREAAISDPMKNISNVSYALRAYLAYHKRFPASAIRDKMGKPLLSWRVELLPFMGEEKLYRDFHLDEPWDSVHNKALIARMPDVFPAPKSTAAPAGTTILLAPVGEKTTFGKPEGTPLGDLFNNLNKKVLFLTVCDEAAVPWTKPEDWPFDPRYPFQKLRPLHRLESKGDPAHPVGALGEISVMALSYGAIGYVSARDPKELTEQLGWNIRSESAIPAADAQNRSSSVGNLMPSDPDQIIEVAIGKSPGAAYYLQSIVINGDPSLSPLNPQGFQRILESVVAKGATPVIYLHADLSEGLTGVANNSINNMAEICRKAGVPVFIHLSEPQDGSSSKTSLADTPTVLSMLGGGKEIIQPASDMRIKLAGPMTEKVTTFQQLIATAKERSKSSAPRRPAILLRTAEQYKQGLLDREAALKEAKEKLQVALKKASSLANEKLKGGSSAMAEKRREREGTLEKSDPSLWASLVEPKLTQTRDRRAQKLACLKDELNVQVRLLGLHSQTLSAAASTATQQRKIKEVLLSKGSVKVADVEAAEREEDLLQLQAQEARSLVQSYQKLVADNGGEGATAARQPPASPPRANPATVPAEKPRIRVELRLAETKPAPGLVESVLRDGKKIYLHEDPFATNQDIAQVNAKLDGGRRSGLRIRFSTEGKAKLAKVHEAHLNKPFAVLFDGKVVMVPTHRKYSEPEVIVEGTFTSDEIDNFVAGIEAGLPLSRIALNADGTSRDISYRVTKIRAALMSKCSVQFIETPLKDALKYFQEQHSIDVILDEGPLTERGVNLESQVNLQISDVTLQSVLNLILRPLRGVDFVIDDEVLKITTKQKAAMKKDRAPALSCELMQNNEVRIRKALRSPCSVQFIETPFKDAMNFLQEQEGIPILIDEVALKDAGVKVDTQVNLQLSEISLRSVLNLIFEPMKNVTYAIEDEVLKIVPIEKTRPEPVKSVPPTVVPGGNYYITPRSVSHTEIAPQPGPIVLPASRPEIGDRTGLEKSAGAFILRSPVEYGKVLGEAYMDAGWPQIKIDATGKSLLDNSTSQRRYLITLLDEYRTQLQLLQVQVALAEVNAQKVDIDYKRVANLHSHKVVADSDLALAKHALDTAQLRLQEIKTLLEVYRRIENDTLKAPTPRPDRMGSRTVYPKVETSKVMSPAEVEARRLRNLRKLGDAMLRYYADHQRFPPAAVLNTDDVPLLSWRVLLLPYLGEAKLFSEFRLNEPWDSAHNRPLAARMPDVYWALGTPREKGVTCLLAPVGKNTVFADPKGMSLADIPDGPETTALVLELPVFSDAVIWTKPQDKEIFGDGSTSFPFHQQNGAVWPILFCDGSVHSLQAPSWSNAASLVAAITRNGKERDDHNRRLGGLLGDVLPPRELPAHYPPEPMFVVDALPDGKIMVDGQLQSSAQLLKQLRTPGPSRLKPVVFLRGETSKGFEPTAKVLDVCREAGVATSVHLYRNRGIGIGPDLDFSKLSQLSGPGGLEERGDAVPLPPIRDSRALNLFKIVLAMVKYTSEHGLTNHGEAVRGKAFGVAFRNPSGQPLLSWRVAVLPYLGEQELYQKFKLNEPWDSPHNGKLAQAMPDIYDFPGMLGPTDIRTAYVAVLSDNSLLGNSDLQKRTGIAPFMIHGGRDQAVIWTKPEDWKVDPQRPLAGLFSQRLNEIPAVFEDQSVRSISTRTLPDRVLSLSIGNDEKLFKDLEQNFGKSLLIQVGIAADGQLTLYKDQSWNSKKVITVVELQELLRAGARQEIRPAVLISFVGDSPRTQTALSIVRHFCRNLGIARLEELDSEPQPAKKGSTPPGKDSPKIEGEKSPAKAPHAAEKLLNASLEPVTGEALVPTLRKRYQGGLKITAVEADGLASRNGLRVGDVLVGLGDHATKSLADLEFVLEKRRAGQEVVLKFYSVRGAETFFGTLKLPKPSAESNHPASPTQSPEKSGTDTKGARSDSSGAVKLPPAGLYAFDRKGYAWLRGTLGYPTFPIWVEPGTDPDPDWYPS